MRSGWLRLTAVYVGLIGAGAACSTVIGISEYEIDPTLGGGIGGGGTGGGGTSTSGGTSSAAGTSTSGGTGGGGASAIGGTAGNAGGGVAEAGAAGASAQPECEKDSDCEDGIACTAGSCGGDGVCVHLPDDMACPAVPGECAACQVGVGCVTTPADVRELLGDPSFDEPTTDWSEESKDWAGVLYYDSTAQSGDSVASFGPAKANTKELAKLHQRVTIPQNTRWLTFSGYYRTFLGNNQTQDEFVRSGLLSQLQPPTAALEFFKFGASDQIDWKRFSYEASRSQVQEVVNKTYRFALVAESWETEFQFDTLSLRAAVCE